MTTATIGDNDFDLFSAPENRQTLVVSCHYTGEELSRYTSLYFADIVAEVRRIAGSENDAAIDAATEQWVGEFAMA